MGNSALIVVAATVLSGILILSNAQRISTESTIVQAQMQEDVLARDLALTGHNLALAEMLGNPGTVSTTLSYGNAPVAYNGGTFLIDQYTIGSGNTIDLRVVGAYGDAQHLIHSRYRMQLGLETMGAFDVPNLTITASDSARINGGPDNKELWIGTGEYNRMNAIPELSGLLDMDRMTDALNDQLQNADDGLPGNVTEVTVKDGEDAFNEALPDIDSNQDEPWLQEFYYKTVDNMRLDGSTPDAYFPGSMQFGGVGTGGDEIDDGSTPSYTYNFGTPGNTSIVRINGDAHLRAGAQLTGHGILIVEGDLTVDAGAVLDWDGFVYLRPKESYSQSRFDGLVNIRGALLAYQEAIPPGSHMDVTTHRDLTGTWSIPRGTEANQAGIPIPGPWFVHRHKWDQQWNARPPIAVDRVVTFLRNGTAPATHENYLRFSESLQDFLSAGITDIYLKFDNRSQNGMGTFLFEYTDPATGALRTRSGSIPSGFDGSGSVTSPTIPVASLRSMEMQFRSLRLLQFMQDPDPNGSLDDGAHRVSNDHSRQGSFHLEIYDAATDRLIMTTSVYQHIREDEDDEYEEELNQLHDDIVNGHFGLNLVLGPYTQFVYDESSVADAMDRIRPRQVAHLGSWTQRCNQIDATCNLTSAP